MNTDIKVTDEVVGGVLNNLGHLQELVQSIQKLTDTYNTLKSRVESLEHELAEKRKELLEKESWANLGKLSAFIAHEIRSPINAIILYLDHLKEYANGLAEAPVVKSILQNIELAVNNINTFITDMLTLSKDLKLVKETLLISEIVSDLQQKVEVLICKKPNVIIKFNIGEDLKVEVDRKYFEQAIFNLIKNASEAIGIKNSNHLKEESISVSFYRNDSVLCIEVSDTGCGISSEIRENLFTPFASNKRGGFGLGLAFAKKIITAHNGTIDLKTTGPGGTTFLIQIPYWG